MRASIIMPAYNRAYVIGEAVASALAQSWRDFELLVVDDGSRDNTRDVVAGFDDPRIRYLRHSRNRGCFAAYNTGLICAGGDLISFLDSDDLWKSDKLEREVQFFEEHPEADAVFTDLEKEDGGERFPSFMRETGYFSKMLAGKNSPAQVVFSKREIYLCLLREVAIKPTALTLRTEAVRKTGLFDVTRPSGSEWDYLIRFARKFRFGYIDDPLAVLRVQTDATHREHRIADLRGTLSMLKIQMNSAVSRRDPEALQAAKHGYRDASKHLAWTYLCTGQKRDAARAFLRGFRESGDVGMLARALLACFPRDTRENFKRALGRQENRSRT